MKVVAIDGSPRVGGNTHLALDVAKQELEKQGIEVEILKVGNKEVKGCIACGGCYKTGECVLADETFVEYCGKMVEADGILLASPVYYAGIAGTMKSFLDRIFYAYGSKMRHKVGGAIGVARRDGGVVTVDQLHKYFFITEMIAAPTSYWLSVYGAAKGEVLKDEEGVDSIIAMAQHMAWLLKMKDATKDTITPPKKLNKRRYNFVR